ncbi:hypothetical protein [Hydrogenophaga intermedia]|nr:hypothetical protein [Hydrogenophaga intermedia]
MVGILDRGKESLALDQRRRRQRTWFARRARQRGQPAANLEESSQ